MTALIVGITVGYLIAFGLLARDAYQQAALQRAVCVACNPTLTGATFRVLANVDQFTAALRRVAASYASLGEAMRRFDQRLQPLVDLPPIEAPTRSAQFFLTASERWETWRQRNTTTYVPKHRAPRRGA